MKILLATDGSDCARQAIDFLRRFPIPDNSSVILLTVLVKEFFKGRDKSDLSPEQRDLLHQTKQEMRDEGKYLLEEEAKEVRGARLKVETLVRSGHPAEEIVLAAKELSSDLVVVGSHGLTGIKRFLLGSVSNHVLEYAPCSVLIVKECGEEDRVAKKQALRVLLAYDNSDPARYAVEFMAALPLGEYTHVRALSVLPVIKMFRQDIKQRLSWVWQEKKLLSERALARITHEVRWGHPEIETELREGEDVSQEILNAASRDHSDLIVLGHKGKGAIDRFLLGSVTSRVAHHAECSVLAVRK
jgi:nucleotide-binding universal stress UspA family protein